jgi:hypothetical protein
MRREFVHGPKMGRNQQELQVSTYRGNRGKLKNPLQKQQDLVIALESRLLKEENNFFSHQEAMCQSIPALDLHFIHQDHKEELGFFPGKTGRSILTFHDDPHFAVFYRPVGRKRRTLHNSRHATGRPGRENRVSEVEFVEHFTNGSILCRASRLSLEVHL